MICMSCGTAGDLNQASREQIAEEWHSECQYPSSCPCQHSVGKGWVNRGNARS